MSIICGEHFIRAGTDLYCDLPANHQGDHGLMSDHKPSDSRLDDPIKDPLEAHERVMARALDIVAEHTREHGELWREADATELGAMARHKANRVSYAARRFTEGAGKERAKQRIVDSALDGINYLVFIVLLVENDGRR